MPQLKPKINIFLCNASEHHRLHKQPGRKINNSVKFQKITFLSPNRLVNRQLKIPQYATGLTEQLLLRSILWHPNKSLYSARINRLPISKLWKQAAITHDYEKIEGDSLTDDRPSAS